MRRFVLCAILFIGYSAAFAYAGITPLIAVVIAAAILIALLWLAGDV